MIRLRGFARKTRRLTKGGSLSADPREVGDRSADAALSSGSETQMGNNGHNGTNGNHQNGTHDRNGSGSNGVNESIAASDRNGDKMNGNGHSAIEELIERTPIESRLPLEHNGHHSPIDRASVPKLDTLFARVALSDHVAPRPPTWKRVLDVTFILLAFPIWLPLLLVVMAWIKLVSPGPIFYRQERVGYRGSRFLIFKFRTMQVNAETRTHEEYFARLMKSDCPMTKLDALDDHRLIRCGRLLRATGLDELPQLFNVLWGEMTLVGPRPCLPNEFRRYSPAQQKRVDAPPGITGYWQVNGKNKTTFSEMIAMDIFYCENMSLWLDLRIIFRTIPALITQTLESRVRSATEPEIAPIAAPGLNGSARKI
ncbi:MAG TPA: sugar transferase [Chthoniobacterales bacterium]|jgi:lipopolysaccharide/colanic/teichoic acid biosynthesis glycosyltransferase